MTTKLLNVTATFEFVMAYEPEDADEDNLSVEYANWRTIRKVSDVAISDNLTNNSGYNITINEIESKRDLPEDWCGVEVPYSENEKENRTINEILEIKKNLNKNYNVNIKLTF